ncbi:MAG: amidohydrolase family protein [Candidatus Acidiferrales bacterium]
MNCFHRILLVLLAAGFCAGSSCPAEERLVIKDVTVIDATGAAAQPNQTVVIANGRIEEVRPSRKVRMPAGARVIDGKGHFLIPGLWDMHVHLAGIVADPVWSKETLLPLLIANGVTGVRDMGGKLAALIAWRQEIAAGKLPGPHLFFSGPMIDGAAFGDLDIIAVKSPEEGRQTVDELQQQGADFIKVLSRLNRESYFAIAQESKARGIRFAGHVPVAVGTGEASDAGQQSIEHILYGGFAVACAKNEADFRAQLVEAFKNGRILAIAKVIDAAQAQYDPEIASALWKKLVANQTWVVPTLVSTYTSGRLDQLAAKNEFLKYLPQSVSKDWAPAEIQTATVPTKLEWYQSQLKAHIKLVGEMHRAGVRLLAGTDSLDTYEFPGYSLHQELQFLVQAGLTPMEALQTATLNAAAFLGKQSDYGTIQKGKVADVVLLDANPLENIANTRKIRGVVVAGRFLDQEALSGMLENARKAAAQAK